MRAFSTSPILLFQLAASKSLELSLARNEREAFQVAVLPRRKRLQDVSVCVSDLRSDAGDIFDATNIDCDVMGYVETKKRPPYAVSCPSTRTIRRSCTNIATIWPT